MKRIAKRRLSILAVALIGLVVCSSLLFLFHQIGLGGRRTIAAKINASELRELSLKPIDDPIVHAYAYETNEFRVIPSLEKVRLNTMVEGKLPVFESNGFNFVILHKWVNSSSGVAYGSMSPTNFPSQFHFEQMQHDLWFWTLNLQR